MQSEIFLFPDQPLQKEIFRYLKDYQRFYFQTLSFWIPQTDEIILASDKKKCMAEYRHIGRMI